MLKKLIALPNLNLGDEEKIDNYNSFKLNNLKFIEEISEENNSYYSNRPIINKNF